MCLRSRPNYIGSVGHLQTLTVQRAIIAQAAQTWCKLHCLPGVRQRNALPAPLKSSRQHKLCSLQRPALKSSFTVPAGNVEQQASM